MCFTIGNILVYKIEMSACSHKVRHLPSDEDVCFLDASERNTF